MLFAPGASQCWNSGIEVSPCNTIQGIENAHAYCKLAIGMLIGLGLAMVLLYPKHFGLKLQPFSVWFYLLNVTQSVLYTRLYAVIVCVSLTSLRQPFSSACLHF